MVWQRRPNEKQPGVPDEEDVFDRPGDVQSTPRDWKPIDGDNPDRFGRGHLPMAFLECLMKRTCLRDMGL